MSKIKHHINSTLYYRTLWFENRKNLIPRIGGIYILTHKCSLLWTDPIETPSFSVIFLIIMLSFLWNSRYLKKVYRIIKKNDLRELIFKG